MISDARLCTIDLLQIVMSFVPKIDIMLATYAVSFMTWTARSWILACSKELPLYWLRESSSSIGISGFSKTSRRDIPRRLIKRRVVDVATTAQRILKPRFSSVGDIGNAGILTKCQGSSIPAASRNTRPVSFGKVRSRHHTHEEYIQDTD